MFGKEVAEAFKAYAIAQYPNEACGFVIGDQFVPKQNIHEDPQNYFRINPREWLLAGPSVQAILHSHTDGTKWPSKNDMEAQIASARPWGMLSAGPDSATELFYFGKGVPIPDLLGRTYRHGPSGTDKAGDCYALIKDYFALKGIEIPEFPRDHDFADRGEKLYEENFEKAGFHKISESELQEGDVFLMSIRAPGMSNHGGVYVGQGLGLHHLLNSVSRREPLHRWKKHITHYLRYHGDVEWVE